MDISTFLQLAISGILMGGLYALLAFGLSLTYGVARIMNFAHGTMLAMAAIVGSIMYERTGWNPFLLILVIAPTAFAIGYAYYLALLSPLRRRTALEANVGTVLVTVGSLIIISDVTAALAGSQPRNILLQSNVIQLGNIVISSTQMIAFCVICALTVVLSLILKRTWFGLAVRAVTQDHVGATICGVSASRIHACTFGVGSALAAIAGVLYASSFPIDPYAGFGLTVRAFTIIVLGGLGNLLGAFFAAVLLGICESCTSFFLGSQWTYGISIVILLGFLVMFPNGLRAGRTV
ncbi:Branched-chain amino acid ABC-type transport system, permease component [Paraburkholderia caribensis MBA4]|uniref:Branched-chain amino acid ABC-type transport system, permease component n=2 Tax=Paraburkholderia caribensis TaxID=75105 RepID=A0A0P0RI92_9BURK|nr:Branched-chain amino acid ABC-type transport system, permease component [Paraburkholderia caribensis MBA4]